MVPERANQAKVDLQRTEWHYGPGKLPGVLSAWQHEGSTGLAHIRTISDGGVCQRVFAFREGRIVYAGMAVPSPQEFILELNQYERIRLLDTVLEFATKRDSVQAVLRAMTDIGVLSWPAIVRAMRVQAVGILADVLPFAGEIFFEKGNEALDLYYENAEPGFTLDALLLALEVQQNGAGVTPSAARQAEVVPTILSVDDSPIAQAFVQRILGRDYRLKTCGSAVEAWQVLRDSDDIALMLLDLTLPDLDGLTFCRKVRALEKFKGLPIVMVTARDGMINRARGHLAGTTHYLTKPLNPQQLLEIARQYLAV